MSTNAIDKPSRLGVWGHSMVVQLPGVSRKRRKREASKKRRVIAHQETQRRANEAGV
jgi:hypothetical protein